MGLDSADDTNTEEYDEEEEEEEEEAEENSDDIQGGDTDNAERGREQSVEEEWIRNSHKMKAEAGEEGYGRNRRLQLIEANSPAVFVRELGLKIDASAAPQLRHYSWNLRYVADEELEYVEPCQLTEILTVDRMRQLADVYFVEVHPVYSFVDRQCVDQLIVSKWPHDRNTSRNDSRSDSLLSGIAALGCLFSKEENNHHLESRLVQIHRISLEHSCGLSFPSVEHVMGWLLRVIYLRLAGSLQATWVSTCTLMHLIETTKLHLEPSRGFSSSVLLSSILTQQSEHEQYSDPNPESRRRIFWVAQLFNTWCSIDCGKSPVELRGSLSLVPRDSWTDAQRQLWHSSIFLNPDRTRSHSELVTEFEQLCSVKPSHPMLLLIQCNIALCICRRLRALRVAVCGDDRFWPVFLSVARDSLAAARNLSLQRSPWCHVLNVPFQLSCTFLALDKPESLWPLREAMDTLKLVMERYDSKSARDSYRVACYLTIMKHRQRCEELNVLDRVLRNHNNDGGNNDSSSISNSNNNNNNTSNMSYMGTGDMAAPAFPYAHGLSPSTAIAQPVRPGTSGDIPYTELSLDFMNGLLSDPYFTLDYQFPFGMV